MTPRSWFIWTLLVSLMLVILGAALKAKAQEAPQNWNLETGNVSFATPKPAIDKTFLLAHGAALAAIMVDTQSTVTYMHHCRRVFPTQTTYCGEENPLLGRRPSDARLYAYAAGQSAALVGVDYLLARALRKTKWRRAWLIVPIAMIGTRSLLAVRNQRNTAILKMWER